MYSPFLHYLSNINHFDSDPVPRGFHEFLDEIVRADDCFEVQLRPLLNPSNWRMDLLGQQHRNKPRAFLGYRVNQRGTLELNWCPHPDMGVHVEDHGDWKRWDNSQEWGSEPMNRIFAIQDARSGFRNADLDDSIMFAIAHIGRRVETLLGFCIDVAWGNHLVWEYQDRRDGRVNYIAIHSDARVSDDRQLSQVKEWWTRHYADSFGMTMEQAMHVGSEATGTAWLKALNTRTKKPLTLKQAEDIASKLRVATTALGQTAHDSPEIIRDERGKANTTVTSAHGSRVRR